MQTSGRTVSQGEAIISAKVLWQEKVWNVLKTSRRLYEYLC